MNRNIILSILLLAATSSLAASYTFTPEGTIMTKGTAYGWEASKSFPNGSLIKSTAGTFIAVNSGTTGTTAPTMSGTNGTLNLMIIPDNPQHLIISLMSGTTYIGIDCTATVGSGVGLEGFGSYIKFDWSDFNFLTANGGSVNVTIY